MAPTIVSKNADVARLAQLILAGAATEELCAGANEHDVRAIKSDTGVMHYRATTVGRIAATADEAKADTASRTFRFVASEESADRMGDIIRVAGWNLGNFKKNPIALANHDTECPIGTVANMVKATGEKPPRLYESITYPVPGASPESDVSRALVEAGVLRAVSVGFIPELMMWPESDDERQSLGVGRFGVVYEKQEQLELSVCSIPCHPSALITPKGSSAHRSHLLSAIKRLVREGKIEHDAAQEFVARCGWSVRKLFPVVRVLRVPAASIELGEPTIELQRGADGALGLAPLTRAAGSTFKVGDRVRVKDGRAHDEMTADVDGTVEEVSSAALGVRFEGMDEVHHWYVADELQAIEEDEGKDLGAASGDSASTLANDANQLTVQALLARADAQDKRLGELSARLDETQRALADARAQVSRSGAPESFYSAIDEQSVLAALDRKLGGERAA
jgi:hypothetical protein